MIPLADQFLKLRELWEGLKNDLKAKISTTGGAQVEGISERGEDMGIFFFGIWKWGGCENGGDVANLRKMRGISPHIPPKMGGIR